MISTTELWELIGRLSRMDDPLTHAPSDKPGLAQGQGLGQGCHNSKLDDISSGDGDGNDNGSSGGDSGGCGDKSASTYSIANYLLHQVPFTHPQHTLFICLLLTYISIELSTFD